jgi:hypothetical protein
VSKEVIYLFASISALQHFSFSFSLAARCAIRGRSLPLEWHQAQGCRVRRVEWSNLIASTAAVAVVA